MLNINQDLAIAASPVAFARSLGVEPDEWQQKVLLSSSKRIQILASRQSGKSLTCAIYGLWFALNHPNVNVLVISASQRQSSLLFRTIIELYRQLGRPIPADVEAATTLTLANKSSIFALPGVERTIRGYNANCIIFDESEMIDDDTYHAVRPMAAVNDAKVFAIGTARGQRGWFWDSWEHSDEFDKVKVTASEVPRISPAFLAQERLSMGQYWYDAEYECIFSPNMASVFRMDLIENSIADFEELPLFLDDDEPGILRDLVQPKDLTTGDSESESDLDLDLDLGDE